MGELSSYEFQGKTLCLSALRVLFDIGRKKWTAIKNVASTSGVSPIHKGKGKPSNMHLRDDNPVLNALCNHFRELEDLGEPIATRIVREVTGEVTECNNADNNICLPMCLQKRLLYH